jgi:UDP-N-acetylglucosamine--N-acetylmuramyl-(pentapeptide) pyrophosphoryl-undecaprenol N-acetylglucosamine transferase
MKFIISGGGTGGHIYPAIAIAEAIKKQMPEAEFLFIGAEGRMEMEKVPQAGYKIEGLWISGFQRKQLWKNLSLPFKILFSMFKVWGIISKFKPDTVIGVGGYASGVALKVAGWRKIPILIHEQNSFAGKTNQMLAKSAKKICVAYDNMERFFPKDKMILTGNPVRQDILDISTKKAEGLAHYGLSPDKKVLLITGGSLGAKTLNESIAAGLQSLKDANIQVLWQVGKVYYETYAPKASGFDNVKVMSFIDRMDLAYAAADAVIARAGALTISELCVTGKATILVPSPNVAEDHQTANAMSLVNKEAAILVKDVEAKEKLVNTALNLLYDEVLRVKLEQQIKKLALPDAAERIAKECIKIGTGE